MNDYYLGLDMGTSTVGWAVTDENYNLLRKKGKDLWGVREFEEAETAAGRRINRTSRRRQQRKVARIGLLKYYFEEAIAEVDPYFYARLENSKYHLEDKDDCVKTKNALFNDPGFTDKEYFEKYPTIFHLRQELIHNSAPHDVRLVFLAILNIYKHRGHFLNAGVSSEETVKIGSAYTLLRQLLEDTLDICLLDIEPNILEEILSNRDLSRLRKSEQISEALKLTKQNKQEVAIIKTICGLKGDAKVLFGLEDTEEKIEICFSSFGYEEKEPEIQAAIGDDLFEIVTAMKMIYDIGSLASILRGSDFLSDARVKDYEKHHQDLQILKAVMKEYASLEEYDKMFRSDSDGTYGAYVKSINDPKGKEKIRRSSKSAGRKQEIFYATTKKQIEKLKKAHSSDARLDYIINEISLERFMPKQLTPSNGVIPYQVHEKELKVILRHAQEYLPFLNEVDESGLTVSERILRVFAFQIPYYVGPLSKYSENVPENSKNKKGTGWVVRKEDGQVLPWNLEQKIDKKATAEKFISRMVRKCTYMKGQQVLPKSSLLYEEYCVLNEINNLKIDNERILVPLKQDIYNELFKKGKKVKKSQLIKYLIARGLITSEDQVSGIDVSINNALSSYGKFKAIFGDDIDTDDGKKMVEDIIFWCTVYGDSKSFLVEMIEEHYPEVSKDKIKRITGMKFKDWGRFSKEFLQLQGCDKSSGEIISLSKALWETNYNLMELIHSADFTFKEALEELEASAWSSLSEIKPEVLDEYYFSAPVKKMIWQTIGIINELEHILGQAPAKVFIEMTRSNDVKGDAGRKDSRKKQLLELYKNIKDETHDWKKLIEKEDESGRLRSKKMFLYITQMGRDMYTGKPIDLDDLFDNNLYDIDHIYPRHFVKDDSIHNNLVLVRKEQNAHKSDTYPLEAKIRNSVEVRELWSALKTKGLITEEKYKRLTGTKEFTEEQKADFIARQMVETGQATKGVADILKQVLPETEIVYAKASNVSDFRKKYELPKSRLVNDFHHANDAYLNIVVGNAYVTKFTNNPLNFIKKEYALDRNKNNYHISKMFDKDIVRGEKVAWIAPVDGGAPGTIAIVKKMMSKNTPLITRQSFVGHGGIADQTLYSHRKAKEDGYISLKSSDEKMADVKKYGGFASVSTAYFFLVEHDVKKKRVRTLETVPIYLKEKIESDPIELERYCENVLKLQNYSIRLRKIKIQSLIKLNGFYVHISGKTGKQIILRNAVNMSLKKEWMEYIKKLEKYEKEKIQDEQISEVKNKKIYEQLLDKHLNTIFKKRPNPVGERLDQGKEMYEKLSLERQIKVILEILNLSAIGAYTADLSLIGGAGMSGKMLMSKEISKNQEIILINQSSTGLYNAPEIDLLTV